MDIGIMSFSLLQYIHHDADLFLDLVEHSLVFIFISKIKEVFFWRKKYCIVVFAWGLSLTITCFFCEYLIHREYRPMYEKLRKEKEEKAASEKEKNREAFQKDHIHGLSKKGSL